MTKGLNGLGLKAGQVYLKTGTGADKMRISLFKSSSTCRSKTPAVPPHSSISVGKVTSRSSDI